MADVTYTLPDTPEILELAKAKFALDIKAGELTNAKARAEIAKLKAEERRVSGEALAQAELARQLKADADVSEVRALDSLETYRMNQARDFYHCTYRFTDPVLPDTVEDCINVLTIWDRIHPGEPFEIVFNSPGGSVIDGMDLFDFIQELRRRGHNVTTAARGMAASMGGILLQAGDQRVMGREAYMLIHEISMNGYGGKTSDIEDEVQFLKKMQLRVLHLFARRSAEAKANGTAEFALTADDIENGNEEHGFPGWKRKDRWLDSDECLRFGLVDELR